MASLQRSAAFGADAPFRFTHIANSPQFASPKVSIAPTPGPATCGCGTKGVCGCSGAGNQPVDSFKAG
jgi:hypothetical protein